MGKPAHMFYISDWDPQGERMPFSASRHIEYRLRQCAEHCEVTVEPLALTPEQIKRYKLPRVPIKSSNRLRDTFEEAYGEGATELDALEAIVAWRAGTDGARHGAPLPRPNDPASSAECTG